jgi:hypothetical protein
MSGPGKVRDEPEAMAVMTLKAYDEAEGLVDEAIMKKYAVGPRPCVTQTAGAEEGLLASLDHRGAVELSSTAKLFDRLADAVVAEPAT